MHGGKQAEIALNLLENAPSLLFLTIWRASGDIQVAGWIGACTALFALAVLRTLRREAHPILLGLNVHFLIAAPTIECAYWLGFSSLTKFLLDYLQAGVLIMILVVGAVMTLTTGKGFVGVHSRGNTSLHYSLVLLGVALGGVIWACFLRHNSVLALMPPLLALFLLRQLLAARLQDRTGISDKIPSVVAMAGATHDRSYQSGEV